MSDLLDVLEDYDFASFRAYWEASGIVVGEVEEQFVQWRLRERGRCEHEQTGSA